MGCGLHHIVWKGEPEPGCRGMVVGIVSNMGNWRQQYYGSSPQFMSNVTSALMVLLMGLGEVTASTNLNYMNFPLMSNITKNRGLLGSKSEFNPITIDLMHIHHVDSPYVESNMTFSERIHLLMENDKKRMNYMAHPNFHNDNTVGQEHMFVEPIHSGQGVYIMGIKITSTSKVYGLIMDAGSSLIWMQCQPCIECHGQPEEIFNPTVESPHSYRAVRYTDVLCQSLPQNMRSPGHFGECVYSIFYGSSSNDITSKGTWSQEDFSFSGENHGTSVRLVFGCGHKNTGGFKGRAGMVGMGLGEFSLIMQVKKLFPPDVHFAFSYCLVNYHDAPTKTSNLLLGPGNRPREYFYTTLIANPYHGGHQQHYFLDLLAITIDGHQVHFQEHDPFRFREATHLNLGNGGFAIDSGSTLTYLVGPAYEPLLDQIKSRINYPLPNPHHAPANLKDFGVCYDVSGVAEPKYPQVIFHFRDKLTLFLPPQNLFLNLYPGQIDCLGINLSPSSVSVLGNIQQQDYDIVYEIDEHRIGFAIYKC